VFDVNILTIQFTDQNSD